MDASDDLLDLSDSALACERCDAPPVRRLLPLLAGPTAVWTCSRGHGAIALADPVIAPVTSPAVA